jgi:hypothetical protein
MKLPLVLRQFLDVYVYGLIMNVFAIDSCMKYYIMQKHKSGNPDTVGNHNICLHEKNDEINFIRGIKLDDSSERIQQFPLLTASAAIFSVSMIFLTNLSRQLHFCYSFTQDFVLHFKSWVENDFDFAMIHSMSTEGNLNPIP